ncbi:unnamed protein product, partial [Polarella glacialis]
MGAAMTSSMALPAGLRTPGLLSSSSGVRPWARKVNAPGLCSQRFSCESLVALFSAAFCLPSGHHRAGALRRRLHGMRRLSTNRAEEASVSSQPHRQNFRRVTIVRSERVSGERLRSLPPVLLGQDRSGGAQAPSVFVHTAGSEALRSRPWLGFGGSFTEAAAVTLEKMSAGRREEVLRSYFDPQRGLGYNLGRIPIGSCDFSLYPWTCGELVEGDSELRGFSLSRYEEAMLPMLRQAVKLRGGPIELMASPWSPPPWMKTVRSFNGEGRLLPAYRDLWAKHFVRFVQDMGKAGVPIWAVSVQNEPEAAQCWESCLYSAEEECIFVRDHLGPALHDAGLEDVNILVWDHNRDGLLERAAAIYDDPVASKFVWGVAYHWYGDARFESWPPRSKVPFEDRQDEGATIFELRACAGFDNVRLVADLRPDKHILFTEGCQELGGRPLASVMGDWKLGERYAMNIISDMNSGCEGWIDWNLCL